MRIKPTGANRITFRLALTDVTEDDAFRARWSKFDLWPESAEIRFDLDDENGTLEFYDIKVEGYRVAKAGGPTKQPLTSEFYAYLNDDDFPQAVHNMIEASRFYVTGLLDEQLAAEVRSA